MIRDPDTNDRPVTIRVAGSEDDGRIRRLIALDSSQALTGHLLLAEQDGEPAAVISLGTGAVAADPFRRTAVAVHLLRLRRYQLLRQGGDVRHARSLVRRLLPDIAR